MCILILCGPQADPAQFLPVMLPECAGRALRTVVCTDVDSLIAALQAAGGDAEVELVLLDSGDLSPSAHVHAKALRAALDALPTPYIELHTDGAQELEPWLHPQHAPLAVVITPHDASRAYAMSLGIAARCLPSLCAPLRAAA
ncbi:Hypothetical Protein LMG19146_03963 [Xanthomonas arboricola pv. fragariae]|uniref:hypothetical protein n=1 Tax=Xanthomonas arboricola TaxID=56448 RepID=UPI000C833D40|nr:hypothetical protein [Xanthomonas arboricola]MBB6575878.1 3-dehydroquinate dehydratase [Xanthomonas arboricola]NIK34343.1 3-dehydroquinate dehydratase [Xanthomonas arboricola]PPT48280.1 hypothetical protein XarbCFBP8147_16310 [Xanthomonas arboricola]PPT87302.1 hypothetical protein XarbCFBP8149_14360 [Xanthomonas arboricola]SOU05032.1 Hypothetical Protein LMG19146_03963 [Xanthomonas arboricola pv. fragariae]